MVAYFFRKKIVLSAALLIIGSTPALLQKTIFLPVQKLTTKQGLSSPNVRKILQDKYGFTWFATQDGLSRFDGINFINFTGNNRDHNKSLLTSDVFDIHFDETGNYLWVLTAYGGLNKIDVARSSVIARSRLQNSTAAASGYWLKCMGINGKEVLVGSNESALIRFNTEKNTTEFIEEIPESSRPQAHLDEIFVDSLKRVWLFYSNYGVLIKNKELTKTIAFIPAEDLNAGVKTIEFTGKTYTGNKLLITTSHGLKIISVADLSIVNARKFLPGSPAFLAEESLNAIFANDKEIFCTSKNGLLKIDRRAGNWINILPAKNYEDKEWFSISGSIYQSGKTIWLGSQYGVAWIKNIHTAFTSYYTSMDAGSPKIEHSMSLLPMNDSIVYSCTDVGLFRVNCNTSTITRIGPAAVFFSIGRLNNDLFLVSGEKGSLLISANGQSYPVSSRFPELKIIDTDALIDIRSINDSLYFFSSQFQKGLHIWDRKNKTIRTITASSQKNSLQSNVINRVFIDSKKTVWVICDDVISLIDPSQNEIKNLVLINPDNKQPISINMDICELNNGYWIASYGTGIVQLDETKRLVKIYDSKNGINNLGLYKLFAMNDSTLIASGNNGLSVMNIKNGKVNNFFEGDGLQSNNFEETSGAEYDQHIFMGGIGGLTRIDKKKFLIDNSSPVLFITSVAIQKGNKTIDTSDLFFKKIRVPSNANLVTINFSSLNYSSPDKLKFEYQISQKSDNWIYIGSNHEIPIIPLAPGNYHIKLRAINEAGNLSDPVELTLVFLPKWYQTWWFKLLVVAIIIACAYLLYRMRIGQFKKEKMIRSKLASDLHDDLGSTMNSVKVYASLAMMEKQAEKYLPLIKDGTQEAITGIRDIIWVLDDRKDTIEDLLARINAFASPICDANGIKYKQEISDNARDHKLEQEERRNLYMMMKEAINNAIKYSDGKNITVDMSVIKGKPAVQIKDDGKGFDRTINSEGYGLKNMQRRAKEIRYRAITDSSSENGTTILFQKI